MLFKEERSKWSKSNENKIEAAEMSEIPKYLICPITQLIFLQPVTIIPSGRTYEKEIIDRLLKEATNQNNKLNCPETRIPIEGYVEARNISWAVEEYLKLNPNDINQQYQREIADSKNNSTPQVEASHNITTQPMPEISQQIQRDEALAREFQQRENTLSEERLRQQRERHSLAAFHQQNEQRIRQTQLTPFENQPSRESILTVKEKKEREALIEDIQNLIYALHFENGPQPKGRIDNFALLFFAIIESAFLEPLPWQKIKVAQGPKYPEMYDVLKAAISSLKTIDARILENAKNKATGRYDRVKTVFAGELSLNKNDYAQFARVMGTITNQPGNLVNQMITRTNHFLESIETNHLELGQRNAYV